jgi:hypothetical protein
MQEDTVLDILEMVPSLTKHVRAQISDKFSSVEVRGAMSLLSQIPFTTHST